MSIKNLIKKVYHKIKREPATEVVHELTPEEVSEARLKKLLRNITKEQKGLEIGPMHRPCAPKREGYNVEIVDHMDREGLVERGKTLGIPTEIIEEVDYIWDGRSYSDITGKKDYYDYIIASHVIEHVPDFIGFLNDCSNMLKSTGILSLAVPDKRYTLDHFRMVTNTGKFIDDHLIDPKNGTIGSYIDFSLNLTNRHGFSSWPNRWEDTLPKDYAFVNDHNAVAEKYNNEITNRRYHDFHQHVFTPSSFALVINDLCEYGFIDLKIDKLFDTQEEEFIVLLTPMEDKQPLSRDERMSLISKMSRENVVTI